MVSDGDHNNKQVSKVSEEEQTKQQARQNLKKELNQMLKQEAKWTQEPTIFDKLPRHEKPFPIEPFPHERQRLPFRMTEEDRLRRKAWVHSQQLAEHEPVRVPELERMIYNPIRRLYRLPTDRLFNTLKPVIGETRVPLARYVIPKLFLGWIAGCTLWYQVKYNTATWQERKGFTFIKQRPVYLPVSYSNVQNLD
jgi:hypothetical protein